MNYDDWLLGLKERLSNSNYAKTFFDATVSNFIETRFLPAFIESTDLIIAAQKGLDVDLVRNVHLVRGMVYFVRKDYNNARKNFVLATEADPNDKQAQMMIEVTSLYMELPINEIKVLTDLMGFYSIAASIIEEPPQELRV